MRTVALGLTLALLAAPAFASEAEEETLYRWGECAAVGALYQGAVEGGSSDPRIAAASDAFHNFEPQMEAYTNGLAAALGEDRANAVQARLLADYDSDIQLWAASEDRDGFLLATWGKTMDRCLKEATALPVPGQPKT
ncbi:MAG: hypothetical protein K0R83_303 [Caulobacter sp.]|jgi:hypothetical protein|nr:hypothetical protein [Caulobacter sp.]